MELPSEDALRSIVRGFAEVRATGGELLEDAPLVLPTGDFFPDAWEPTASGIVTFFARMRGYTPISSDLPLQIAFTEDGDAGGSSCGAGACCSPSEMKTARGGVVDTADGYGVVVHTADLGASELMAASLARALGTIVVGELGIEMGARSAIGEIAAVAMGLGVLVAEGAAVFKKGCGGVREHRATALNVEEATTALALFTRISGKKPQSARAHLGTTQREAFDIALSWVDSNTHLVDALRDSPELLVDGIFEIHKTKGMLGRWFSKSKSPSAEEAVPSSKPRRERTKEEEARIAEARALVEDALREG